MQTWNDVLDYIKINLGAQINLIEMTDEEIKNNINNQVLPYFSQYSPAKKYLAINSSNLLPTAKGSPRFNYKLPIEDDDYVIDILDAYSTTTDSIGDFESEIYAFTGREGAMDTVISNSFIDAIKSLGVRNTWEFIPPDTLMFDQEIRFAVVVYNIPHQNLNSIRPDVYHIIFKPLCLATIKIWIASLRSKYEGLNTPFGAINLNWQQLSQEGIQEKAQMDQLLNTLPPDKLLEIA